MRIMPLLALTLLVAGCSIATGMDENKKTEQRITSKEAVLRGEEDRNLSLRADQEQLRKDLARTQMSLDDLNTRLSRLRAQNATSVANSEQQRARKRQIEKQLSDRQAEIGTIKNQGGLSEDEKRRRIAKLKFDIDEELKIQLAL